MDRWEKLRDLLKGILGTDNVYFQPPPSIKLQYPCIILKREADRSLRADNHRYTSKFKYSINYIRRSHDTEIPEKILELPYCAYDRFFTIDGLNHDFFIIYY